MDIEFETSLWTHISALLEKNSTKKEVSRNEPFSGHCTIRDPLYFAR